MSDCPVQQLHKLARVPDGDAGTTLLGDLSTLPGEIRKQVYRQYFFGDGRECRVNQLSHKHPADERIMPCMFPPCNHKRPLRSNISGLSFLVANKQIYHEATAVLYSEAEFQFNDICALKRFLETRAPEQAALIRSLRLDWVSFVWVDCGCKAGAISYLEDYWMPVCQMLVDLPGLQNLHIVIRPGRTDRRGRPSCDTEFLEPLKDIKAPKFVLEI